MTTSEISAQLYLGVFCDTLRLSLVIHGSKFVQLTRGDLLYGCRGVSTRRGMTVLGKIPAVPKPINLPSQRCVVCSGCHFIVHSLHTALSCGCMDLLMWF